MPTSTTTWRADWSVVITIDPTAATQESQLSVDAPFTLIAAVAMTYHHIACLCDVRQFKAFSWQLVKRSLFDGERAILLGLVTSDNGHLVGKAAAV